MVRRPRYGRGGHCAGVHLRRAHRQGGRPFNGPDPLQRRTHPYQPFKKPDYDDIVVVDGYTEYGRPLVKRVIGKGGDTIDIDFTAGIVYRNGEALDEPYTAEPTYLYESVDFPITVPDGCLFLMGDNRNNSTDSRDTRVGCVDERDIMGAAVLRVLPFGKIGAAQ